MSDSETDADSQFVGDMVEEYESDWLSCTVRLSVPVPVTVRLPLRDGETVNVNWSVRLFVIGKAIETLTERSTVAEMVNVPEWSLDCEHDAVIVLSELPVLDSDCVNVRRREETVTQSKTITTYHCLFMEI
jgi:hypothetical protein